MGEFLETTSICAFEIHMAAEEIIGNQLVMTKYQVNLNLNLEY